MIDKCARKVGKLILIVRMQASMIQCSYPLNDCGDIVGRNVFEDPEELLV
jgi:hypothetical protein